MRLRKRCSLRKNNRQPSSNLFAGFSGDGQAEQAQELFRLTAGRVLRIQSCGQVSPPGFWYEEPEDEWIAVLTGEGELEWPDGGRQRLKSGDWLFIPAGEKHRVSYTSSRPPCFWLAVYGRIEVDDG